jgi:hypothetical protein
MLKTDHTFISEFYVVEKVIEVVVRRGGGMERVRIEAMLDPRNGEYSTAAYLREPRDASLTSGDIWVSWSDFPWTAGRSADDVLNRAFGFLRERCDE